MFQPTALERDPMGAESHLSGRLRVAFALLIGLITLLAIVLRLGHINHPMRYDESYNYLHFVIRGPVYIVTHYLPNNHVLHTLSVWISMTLAGNVPAALRVPAFLAGVLLVPATALLAWRVSRRATVAAVSALAVCASSALIEYSTNARGYSMLTLWTVTAAILFHRAIEKPSQNRWWFAWGAAGALGLYTVPIMVLPFAGMAAYGVLVVCVDRLSSNRSSIVRGLVVGCALFVVGGLMVYAPVVAAGGTAPIHESGEMVQRILGEQIPTRGAMLSAIGSLWTRHSSALLIAPAVVGIAVFLWNAFRDGGRARWQLLFPVVVPILLALLINAPMPARTWLFAIPFVWIIAAQGLDDLTRFGESSLIRAVVGPAATTLTGVALVSAMIGASHARTLCSEPGGLVLVEPGLRHCAAFGEERCAFVAPYTPATAYYKSLLGVTPVSDPVSPLADRVYIATSAAKPLDAVWKAGDAAFPFFGRPELIFESPEGSLYVADRVDRNVLR